MPDFSVFYQNFGALAIITAVGFLLGRKKIIKPDTNKAVVNLLLMVALPCALFSAFPTQFDWDSLHLFLWAAGGGLIVFLLAIVLSRLFYRRRTVGKFFREHQFATIFTNASFLGYPLVLAFFGQSIMIAYSGFMLVFDLLLFSYGRWLFEHKLSWRHLWKIVSPALFAEVAGLTLFLLSWQLPAVVELTIHGLAGLASPLSLICIGLMLSQAHNWRYWLSQRRLYLICLVRLLLVPVVALVVLTLLRFPVEVVRVLVLLQALPTATTLVHFANKYGGKGEEASEIVLFTTALSLVTVPVVMWVLG